MIDFTNKCVITESDVESAKLLKMAISQPADDNAPVNF